MNRIVLIGNGFDLAHGLKTNYADFIDWYWEMWGKRLLSSFNRNEQDQLCSFKLNNKVNSAGWYYAWHYHYQLSPFITYSGIEIIETAKQDKELCDYTMSSPLFENICEKLDKGWVDIEDIYYAFLKSSGDPKQINADLDFIKEKLVEYLNSLAEPNINPIILKQILEPINKEDIAISSMKEWENMLKQRFDFQNEDWNQLISGYNLDKEVSNYSTKEIEVFKNAYQEEFQTDNIKDIDARIYPTMRLPDNIMLLDFNYTNTSDMYMPKADKFSVNHIHGSLSNPESVIFGYGDERDDEYDTLMKKNDNEYLRHIKSFRYLDASNYRKMLAFIESAPYQLCIMGHSCGLSDRTLLSTLFEHPNCVSIKPYYHQIDENRDDYRKLVQNIARNFSNPRLMRDRVVGKERCEALGKE